MGKNFLVILVFGLFLSCGQDEEQLIGNPLQLDKYFPLKDFVESQTSRLEGAKVRKISRIKGEEESTEQELDREEWRKELHIFIQADINKSSLAASYDTEVGNDFTIHRLKPGEKSQIQELKVSYERDEVSQVSFVSHQENIFYASGSEGKLIIDLHSGLLTSYLVRGTQKVWFLSPNEMEVEGEIIP